MSSGSLSNSTESYNNSGVFLQSHTVKKFSDYGWQTDTEFPVVVAPFKTDPTRLVGQVKFPGGMGVRSTPFINSIQESQNHFELSERSVDVISARALDDKTDLKVCVECKKLNPRYTEWCFFKQNSTSFTPHVITKSMNNIGVATLFHVPITNLRSDEIFVQINRDYNGFKLLPSNIADSGIALTNETLRNNFFKTEQTVVDQACRQIIEGTYGLIIEDVKSQVISGDATSYGTTSVYLPIVVTNTQLKLCEYDVTDIDSTSGRLTTEPNYQSIDSIMLEYNSPKNVQFPEPLFSALDASLKRAVSKWYVMIVSPKGLEDFLKTCKTLWG